MLNSFGDCRGGALEVVRNCTCLCALPQFLGYDPFVDEGQENKLLNG